MGDSANGPPAGRRAVLLQVDGTPGTGGGTAGLGVVIRDLQGRVLRWRGGRAPAGTSNEAEYQALLLGLRMVAAGYAGTTVWCLTDSQLVVDQLSGRCASRAATLQPLHAQAVALSRQLGGVRFVHVPREVNRLADALAWEAAAGTAQLLAWIESAKGGAG
jgi:ribonuclease HI